MRDLEAGRRQAVTILLHGVIILWAGIATLACGPFGPIPGGRLEGEPSDPPKGGWEFSDDHNTIQLEVRPEDPYSVNLWCVAANGHLYVAGEADSSVWPEALLVDGAARLRIADRIYAVDATRVTDPVEIEPYMEALEAKYPLVDVELGDFQPLPGEEPTSLLFRLDARGVQD